ncbi:MAG: amino acid permease [Saprospirales bacterium]|jgi:APA family basic amino acid/polyamine antiporter|nr:amino acid permease [Saprospirales bacterium]MBK8920452.1 amino acid permease [Saprospirales bacterium]
MEKKQGQLVRSLTLGAATILVVSSVIGSGVYKKVAPMSDQLMSPDLVLWAWVLAGLISLCGALSNAEIAGMLADSGGEYVYFRRIYGRFTAFLWGWSTFAVIKTAAVSSIAYVFTQSLHSIFPLPHLPESIESIDFLIFKPFENAGVKAVTIALILTLTFVNSRGLRGGAALSAWITRSVIVGLALIVLSGLLFGGGSFEHIQTPAANYVDRSWTDFSFIKAMFAALLAAFWAYEGWNTVGFLGGEIQNPNRNLPLALSAGLLIIIGTYVLVNFTYLYVLPIDQIISGYKNQNEIAAVSVVRYFAGGAGATLISIIILITTLGCTNATILMPPRVYYAMAKDGLFFRRAAEIHPKYHTPNPALWMQGIWACLLVLSGSFDQLTDMLIFAAFFFYGATALGVFIMRKREPGAERPYRVWGYPVVPALFVLFCAALIVITCINSPREAMLGIVLMLTGVPFYLYWNRKKPD